MRTYTESFQHDQQLKTSSERVSVPLMTTSMREVLALLASVTAAIGMVMTATWLAGLQANDLVGAASWGIAMMFMGLAVDSSKPVAYLQLATAVTLVLLAWLQNTVSPEFVVAIGVLLAFWAAVTVFRYSR